MLCLISIHRWAFGISRHGYKPSNLAPNIQSSKTGRTEEGKGEGGGVIVRLGLVIALPIDVIILAYRIPLTREVIGRNKYTSGERREG
jgi:hypothetical protein